TSRGGAAGHSPRCSNTRTVKRQLAIGAPVTQRAYDRIVVRRLLACMLLAACGRVGFESLDDASGTGDSAHAPIMWVGPFVQQIDAGLPGGSPSYSVAARQAGDGS